MTRPTAADRAAAYLASHAWVAKGGKPREKLAYRLVEDLLAEYSLLRMELAVLTGSGSGGRSWAAAVTRRKG
jgi:hypothetical protein